MILFLSTAFFPANLMLEPAATIAEYNPLSFIVEGIRDPVISALDGDGRRSKAVARDRSASARSASGSARCALRHRLRTG